MGTRLICLSVLFIGLSGISFAQDVDFEIPSTKSPPIIDGVKDAMYFRSPTQYIIKIYAGAQPRAQSSASWNVLWDEN